MRLSSKMTLRFISYFAVFYIVLLLSVMSLIFYAVYENEKASSYVNLMTMDKMDVEMDIEEKNGSYKLTQKLINSAEKSGGVIHLLDENGQLLASSEKQAVSYTMKELVEIEKHEQGHIWRIKNDQYLVFIQNNTAKNLLEVISDKGIQHISSTTNQHLSKSDAIVEQYSANGQRQKILFGKETKELEPIKILMGSGNLTETKELVASEILKDGSLLVVRMKNPHYNPSEPIFMNGLKKALIVIAVFHVYLLILIVIFSAFIGNRFGRPVLHFLKRIEKLAGQDFGFVNDHKLRRKGNGRLKRKYRIFDEVDQSLTQLSTKLADNECKIQQSEKLREEWITGLSHDLKTPLSSIYGYSKMLSSKDYEWSQNDVLKFAETMQEKAEYMDALIEDLTYTYQLKNNAIVISRGKVYLNAFLNEYVKNTTSENVKIEQMNSEIHILADSILLKRILDNIVGNAEKHTSEGTSIYLQMTELNNKVQLQIRDEGQGIPKEELDNLFNRYYRGTNTTSEASGTGLGLAITKQLVEAMDGEITVQSNSTGTVVIVVFPKLRG
ncbi:HAMP domain-containing sensor histidine kinase [Viridibacillus sp. FSL R5-0477]|uniref:histidine kinase n=1 Tax=Viridibacillus arenosi FSL R5-213 TaxID=1227360 RepID=W4EUJ9_9BACL|nr:MULTISPECIES: HAMP domain-containing sensor histidine kinase [Viridibacillus]ETT84220.1 two-component sensor histidine kinase-like protein [Viridibacillus arenosi FSL R5-213]OMC79259.1 two-component sensor histidine kinase [Viridibacillus sp. FSL H8-0123]OMC86472.1 two-component sensor histidine kinase [Viridibacillus sp. FSL H7-0596]OMC89986.1 two-component sensor histidine kinase [Viridibacillus arenosi]